MDQTPSVPFSESRPPEPKRAPLWLRLPLLPKTIRGWLYLALVLASMVAIYFMLFGPSYSGKIRFGTSIDASTHDLGGVRSSFTVGDTWAFRADLAQAAPGNQLVIRSTQTTPDGVEQPPDEQRGSGTASIGTVYSPQVSQLTAAWVGAWKVEVLQGSTVLASGEFTVSAAPAGSPSGSGG